MIVAYLATNYIFRKLVYVSHFTPKNFQVSGWHIKQHNKPIKCKKGMKCNKA